MTITTTAKTSANTLSCSLHGAKPLLRERDVLAVVPFKKTKLRSEIAAKRFPAPVKISRRMALYRREDVEAYLGRLVNGVVS